MLTSIFTIDFFLQPENILPCLIWLYDSPLYFLSLPIEHLGCLSKQETAKFTECHLRNACIQSEVWNTETPYCLFTQVWFFCLPHQPCACSNRVNKASCSDLFMCNGKASSDYILSIDATVAWCLYYWFEVRSGLVSAKIWGYNISTQEHVNSVY